MIQMYQFNNDKKLLLLSVAAGDGTERDEWRFFKVTSEGNSVKIIAIYVQFKLKLRWELRGV